MTPSERANELKSLLQLHYDIAERLVVLRRDSTSPLLAQIYTEVENTCALLDKALKESIHGSY